jgi:hypothetical protein
MYPHERSLVKRLANQPFALIGVNSDQDKEKLKARMKEEGMNWRSFWDGGSTGGPIASQWNVSGWPTIYVLDQKGTIRYKGTRGEAMDKAVNTLLKEAGVDIDIAELSGELPPPKPAEPTEKPEKTDKDK